ncbi:MAG: MSMEG_1061 family FMN-dependent PPOX-type flavoprotein [Candidatus Binataceae bacterium]
METPTDYRITNVAQLRAIVGEPGALTPHKLLEALDEPAIAFIERAPFLVLATADAAGNQDASPKGDAPGFVAIENPRSILIPDRKGNKLVFTFQNILANPHVGLIFMVPGTDETLRVNGTAELTVEPAVLERLAARGANPQLAIRVTIRECFFHCAKAFMRSQLWHPESWRAPIKISWGEYLAGKVGADAKTAAQIDQFVAQDYKTNL